MEYIRMYIYSQFSVERNELRVVVASGARISLRLSSQISFCVHVWIYVCMHGSCLCYKCKNDLHIHARACVSTRVDAYEMFARELQHARVKLNVRAWYEYCTIYRARVDAAGKLKSLQDINKNMRFFTLSSFEAFIKNTFL